MPLIRNLAISFSGGKTSAYMTRWLLENKKNDYDNIVVTFANTGQENEETLKFVDRCDKAYGFNVVWLEAVVNPIMGKGTRHKVVTLETASRNGEPFEDVCKKYGISVCKKYGISNTVGSYCSRELKLVTMRAYFRSIGWEKGSYETAIGIRVDEMDRISSKMKEEKLIYPLAEEHRMSKEQINRWWAKNDFTLNLKEHQGNCKWCFKKSRRKLLTIAKENPEYFEFPIRMERLYGRAGSHSLDEPKVFFRGKLNGQDILSLSKKPFKPFEEKPVSFDDFDDEMDAANGCSESCEVF